jgi:hypothetical protein
VISDALEHCDSVWMLQPLFAQLLAALIISVVNLLAATPTLAHQHHTRFLVQCAVLMVAMTRFAVSRHAVQ